VDKTSLPGVGREDDDETRQKKIKRKLLKLISKESPPR